MRALWALGLANKENSETSHLQGDFGERDG